MAPAARASWGVAWLCLSVMMYTGKSELLAHPSGVEVSGEMGAHAHVSPAARRLAQVKDDAFTVSSTIKLDCGFTAGYNLGEVVRANVASLVGMAVPEVTDASVTIAGVTSAPAMSRGSRGYSVSPTVSIPRDTGINDPGILLRVQSAMAKVMANGDLLGRLRAAGVPATQLAIPGGFTTGEPPNLPRSARFGPEKWSKEQVELVWVPAILAILLICFFSLGLVFIKQLWPRLCARWLQRERLRNRTAPGMSPNAVHPGGDNAVFPKPFEEEGKGMGVRRRMSAGMERSLGEKIYPVAAQQGAALDSDLTAADVVNEDDIENYLMDGQDQLRPMIKMLIPSALVSLMAAFMLTYSWDIELYFWPATNGIPAGSNYVNASMTAFLAPAGLLYALIFGFAYDMSLHKQLEIQEDMFEEINHLLQMINAIARMETNRNKTMIMEKHRAMALVREQVVMIARSLRREAHEAASDANQTINLWGAVDHMKVIAADGMGDNVDDMLVVRMMDLVQAYTEESTERHALAARKMGLPHWLFMEVLSSTTLIAIIMLRADSFYFELFFSGFAAFSISILTWIIADMDEPFHGFFKVDMHVPILETLRECDKYMRDMWSMEQHVSTIDKLNEHGYTNFLKRQPDTLPGVSRAEFMRQDCYGADYKADRMAMEMRRASMAMHIAGIVESSRPGSREGGPRPGSASSKDTGSRPGTRDGRPNGKAPPPPADGIPGAIASPVKSAVTECLAGPSTSGGHRTPEIQPVTESTSWSAMHMAYGGVMNQPGSMEPCPSPRGPTAPMQSGGSRPASAGPRPPPGAPPATVVYNQRNRRVV